MKGKSKTLSVILVCVLACGMLLSSCATGGSAKPATTTTATTVATPVPATLKPYELRLVFPGPPQKDMPIVLETINKYLTEKINATCKIEQYDFSSWPDQLNLILASAEKVDLMFTASWCGFSSNVAKGAFLPLDELLAKYGKDIKGDLPAEVLGGVKVNGKTYGIPTNKEFAMGHGLLFNKPLVDKYNIDISKFNSIDDLEPALRLIHEKEPDVIPFYMSGYNITGFEKLDVAGDSIAVIDCTVPNPEPKVQIISELPVFKKDAVLLHKWFNDGLINSDAAITQVRGEEKMKTGKVFCWSMILTPTLDTELSYQFGIQLYQRQFGKPLATSEELLGAMIAIPNTSRDPDRAMMLINMLHSDKSLVNLIVFGIENKHYVKKSDTHIDWAPGIDAANPPYANQGWMFGNQFLDYTIGLEPEDKYVRLKNFNLDAQYSPAHGFVFDVTNVKNEVAAVSNIWAELSSITLTGADPEQGISEQITKLKAAGIDKIVAEKQKQLDAFLASRK